MNGVEKIAAIQKIVRRILIAELDLCEEAEDVVTLLTALVSITAKVAAVTSKIAPELLGQMLAEGYRIERESVARMRARQALEEAARK